MSFGDKLKSLRLEKNMTQEDLAKILNVSRATVGRYETNERFPDKNTLKKIADAFEVSIDYLFGRTNNRELNISYVKNSDKYKSIENKIMKRLLAEDIIAKENCIPEEILEDILKYGIDAAIKIAKLEKRLESK